MGEPVEHRFRGEVELAWFEWRGDLAGREPTVFLAHATGFHARVWDAVIARLGERHVISVDQRGHGRSEKVEVAHWEVLGRDLAALARSVGLADAVGVGHSMGGHALVQAAAALPGAFQRLVLVDPVIAAPEAYISLSAGAGGESGMPVGSTGAFGGAAAGAAAGVAGDPGAPHPIVRRKNRFASPDEMFERFRNRPPYSLFEPAALRDYCEHGLLPAPDGEGFVLACPPSVEASVYQSSRTNAGIHDAVRALEIPVRVLRARFSAQREGELDFSGSPTWPDLASAFARGRDHYLPQLTHFIPMQAPGLVAEHVLGSGD